MPLIPDQLDLLSSELDWSEDAQYYQATKLKSEFYSPRFHKKVLDWNQNHDRLEKSLVRFKTYPGMNRVDIEPELSRFQKVNWENVVLERHSTRNFRDAPVSFNELSNLLVLSCGLKENGRWLKKISATQWPRRALPSGGAMQPLEFYILALNISGLARGLYHLDLLNGALSQLRQDDAIFRLDEFWAQCFAFQNPAALIFTTAVFARTRIKYGARALRYILLEAGGIGTHMNLVAGAQGLGFCLDGGGYDDKIEELIGIDGHREGLILMQVLGQLEASPQQNETDRHLENRSRRGGARKR